MILPIIVLYNVPLAESSTYQSLQASGRFLNGPELTIAVYDNSPVRQVSPDEEKHLEYFKHDPTNGGLAAAYNWALQIADQHGFPWLLLLDQDSYLPSSFMQEMQVNALAYETLQDVVAIVPHAQDHGICISPSKVKFGRREPVAPAFSGVSPCELTAINSGALVRASFVQSLGGFSKAFRLDCLDHWLFHQIYLTGKKAVVSSSVINHDLSVLDYRHKISADRYRAILSAETAFVTRYKSRLEIFAYVLRLLCRSVKQLLIYRKIGIAALTATGIGKTAASLTKMYRGVS